MMVVNTIENVSDVEPRRTGKSALSSPPRLLYLVNAACTHLITMSTLASPSFNMFLAIYFQDSRSPQ